MSCRAEIIIEEYDDATYVPVQAVLRVGAEPTVYVWSGKDFEPRKVEVGLDNNVMIRILRGLKAGENVLLTPPLADAAVEQAAGKVAIEKSAAENDKARKARAIDKNDEQKADMEEAEQERSKRKMDPEQMRKMREKFEKMSDEEKEKMRQRRMKRQQQTEGGE